jgi:hypothetical protein
VNASRKPLEVNVMITRVRYVEVYLSFDCPPGVPLPEIQSSHLLYDKSELRDRNFDSAPEAVVQTEGIRLVVYVIRTFRGIVHNLGCKHVAHDLLDEAFDCAKVELERWLQRYKCVPVFEERPNEEARKPSAREQREAMQEGRLWINPDGRPMIDPGFFE